jgi:hypothetical protein
MTPCKLRVYMASGPSYFVNGTAHAITRCETHDWTFEGPASELCPIGRIEQATEQAIAKIKRAKGGD